MGLSCGPPDLLPHVVALAKLNTHLVTNNDNAVRNARMLLSAGYSSADCNC